MSSPAAAATTFQLTPNARGTRHRHSHFAARPSGARRQGQQPVRRHPRAHALRRAGESRAICESERDCGRSPVVWHRRRGGYNEPFSLKPETRRPARRWSRRLLQKSCETTALSSSMTASPPSIMVVAERLHLQPPCNPCHVFLFCALFSATGFSHPHRRGIKHPPWWFQRALVSANHRGGNGEGGRERTAGAIGRAVGKRLVS